MCGSRTANSTRGARVKNGVDRAVAASIRTKAINHRKAPHRAGRDAHRLHRIVRIAIDPAFRRQTKGSSRPLNFHAPFQMTEHRNDPLNHADPTSLRERIPPQAGFFQHYWWEVLLPNRKIKNTSHWRVFVGMAPDVGLTSDPSTHKGFRISEKRKVFLPAPIEAVLELARVLAVQLVFEVCERFPP